MKTSHLSGIFKLLEQEDNFVFLDNAKSDAENYLSYIFLRPKRIIFTHQIDQVKRCLGQLDQALKSNFYAAGFLSYEAGEAFEQRLKAKQTYAFPLLWFGLYKQPLIYNHRRENFERAPHSVQLLIKKISACPQRKAQGYRLNNIRPNISKRSYLRAIAKIKRLITQGFTYQVNYTFKLKFKFSGSPLDLYLNLRNKQSVSYAGLIKLGRYFILSFSPELFFRKKNLAILTRPMKGTAGRGKDLQEDAERAQQLKSCLKNRSENLMIVDLLRNDLGRISRTGSVSVPHLFNIEKYETLLQMTSDIKSRLEPEVSPFDIFSHIFPSGSVTGAPKIKTMQIIRQLEKEPRNVYTGSVGFFSPKNYGTFNVAIRSLLLDKGSGSGQMGVGGGIVSDSSPEQEFAECRLKANFLISSLPEFQLIETMSWLPNQGYFLINEHLNRLKLSAQYFGFPYKKQQLLAKLNKLAQHFQQQAYRVRLLLYKNGNIELDYRLCKRVPEERLKVYLAAKTTQSDNPFLYHKTTNRKLYDREYRRAREKGFYDVLFANQKGEITEGAISNVFIRKDSRWYTPPIHCGLLAGVYRGYLLKSKKIAPEEKVLFAQDLLNADELYLTNSVRGLLKVSLEEEVFDEKWSREGIGRADS